MIDFKNKVGIFKDSDLEREFREKGFVVLRFLEDSQLNELLSLYKKSHPNGVKGFYTTTFANDVDHRETINKEIKAIIKSNIEALFSSYKVLFSSFIVKAPGKDSELIMHQDMTLVDEDKYSGINIWCPLIDLDEKNGAIEVLPKSHRFFRTYRGSSIPDIYDNVVSELKTLMKPCFLKAGEAIIFDQSIIHYSPPNLSNAERPVINTFVAHEDAKIKICYWDKSNGNQIEIFEQEDNFLEQFENFGHNIFNRPSIGKSLGLFPYDFPKLSMEQVHRELGINNTNKSPIKNKKSWLSKIFSKF